MLLDNLKYHVILPSKDNFIEGAVFPTPVGVFLTKLFAIRDVVGLPHARGGVSPYFQAPRARSQSSPRPWGCFLVISYRLHLMLVFPTPVGVFPGKALVRNQL